MKNKEKNKDEETRHLKERISVLEEWEVKFKQAEEKLWEESRLCDTLLDNLPCIALILKKRTREIIVSNKAAREVGAVPGKTCFQTCAQRDDACPFCLAPEVWATDEPRRVEVEYRDRFYECIWFPYSEDLYVHYIFDITERKKAEKIQTLLYKISEAAYSVDNLETLYGSIHAIIGEVIPANNFYIALYDSDHESLYFPYFVDEIEDNPERQKLGKGLTEYVLRTGKSLLASPEVFMELKKAGEIESIGPPSIDWLGIPLKTKNEIMGVMAVQSYTEGLRYSEEDKNMLTFIAEQVAMSIERKQAEEQIKTSLKEKEVMLREIHHRVKNNMQIILSLLRLQSRQIDDIRVSEMFRVSQNRIRSMVFMHESLYRSKDLSHIDFSVYIERITTHLLSVYKQALAHIKLILDVGKAFLDINKAIPCGLIINELVTNSLQHGFPEGKKGEIGISLKVEKKGTFTLIVKDNGAGIPPKIDYRKTKTLGLQLVIDLVDQLEGTVELDRSKGTEFTISF